MNKFEQRLASTEQDDSSEHDVSSEQDVQKDDDVSNHEVRERRNLGNHEKKHRVKPIEYSYKNNVEFLNQKFHYHSPSVK